MSEATKLSKPTLAPTGNRVVKQEMEVVLQKKLEKTCSSSSLIPNKVTNGLRSVKVVPVVISEKVKRCDWITPNSDPLYIAFHDEEWGVPVHEDRKLFELLIFSQALAELSWPAILQQRDIFRKLFENFDPASISKFTEEKLLSLKVNRSLLLSEQKLRAVVENAKQMLKVQEEFGCLSNYLWRFVNQKPQTNGFRYGRQVPVKSPKSEVISKDMMQRGFRCVGPSVIYSFMQVAGFVNDHLTGCFRRRECCSDIHKELNPKSQRQTKTKCLTKATLE